MIVVGGNGQDFWSLSLREIQNVLEAHGERRRIEHNVVMSQSWHIAALGRVKKLPKLKDMLLESPKPPSRNMRPVQVEEVKAWLSRAKR